MNGIHFGDHSIVWDILRNNGQDQFVFAKCNRVYLKLKLSNSLI